MHDAITLITSDASTLIMLVVGLLYFGIVAKNRYFIGLVLALAALLGVFEVLSYMDTGKTITSNCKDIINMSGWAYYSSLTALGVAGIGFIAHFAKKSKRHKK